MPWLSSDISVAAGIPTGMCMAMEISDWIPMGVSGAQLLSSCLSGTSLSFAQSARGVSPIFPTLTNTETEM